MAEELKNSDTNNIDQPDLPELEVQPEPEEEQPEQASQENIPGLTAMDGEPVKKKDFVSDATSRLYFPETKKLQVKNLAKSLDLSDIGNIKVIVKDAASKHDKKHTGRSAHVKKFNYVPIELTPEEIAAKEAEKEKKQAEEAKKKTKGKGKGKGKGKSQKEKKSLTESGLFPKLIILGFIILIGLAIWAYITLT